MYKEILTMILLLTGGGLCNAQSPNTNSVNRNPPVPTITLPAVAAQGAVILSQQPTGQLTREELSKQKQIAALPVPQNINTSGEANAKQGPLTRAQAGSYIPKVFLQSKVGGAEQHN